MKFNILLFVVVIYPIFFIQTCCPTEELSCYSCFDFEPPNPHFKSKGGPCFEISDKTDVKSNCQFCSTRKSQSEKEGTFVIERDCISDENDVEWIKTLELNQWIDYNDTSRIGFVRYCNDSSNCNTHPFLKKSFELTPSQSPDSNPKFYSSYKFIIIIVFVCVFTFLVFSAVSIGIFLSYQQKKLVEAEANEEMENAAKNNRQVTSVAVVDPMENNDEAVNQEMKEKNKVEADHEVNNATPTKTSSTIVAKSTKASSTNVARTTNASSTNVAKTTKARSRSVDRAPKVALNKHDPFSSEA